MGFRLLLCFVGLGLVAPTLANAAEIYIRCDFTGDIQATMTFELETEAETVSGISIAAPNWGTMQLDQAPSGQLVAHMKHGIPQHPDAVLTFIANRVTGSASLFYSPPVKNALDLFFRDTPYQRGDGQCQKAERAF